MGPEPSSSVVAIVDEVGRQSPQELGLRGGDRNVVENVPAYDEQALGAGAGEEAAQGDRHLDAARNSGKNDSGPAILFASNELFRKHPAILFVRFGGIGWRKMVCVGGVLIFGVGAVWIRVT